MSFLKQIARTVRTDDEFFRTDSSRHSNSMPVRSNGRWTAISFKTAIRSERFRVRGHIFGKKKIDACSKQCYAPEIFDVALCQSETQPYHTWYLCWSVPHAIRIILLICNIETDAIVTSTFQRRSKLYTEPVNRCMECVISRAPFPEHHSHCPLKSGVHQTTQQQ